jgi:ribosomal protein S18 acetylase RimI-like enzyme
MLGQTLPASSIRKSFKVRKVSTKPGPRVPHPSRSLRRLGMPRFSPDHPKPFKVSPPEPPHRNRHRERYTAGMYQIRAATPADANVITHHRRRMFVDAGRQDNEILDVMEENFKPWVQARLADGRYLGWLTTEDGTVIAGAGLIILDWPPHPLDPRQEKRGYLLNVYVEPEHRRKKLASHLIDQALAEARKQKIRVVALHSTDAGKPLYESNGFRRTNEMFYVEPVEG